jgi:hypothetical protein
MEFKRIGAYIMGLGILILLGSGVYYVVIDQSKPDPEKIETLSDAADYVFSDSRKDSKKKKVVPYAFVGGVVLVLGGVFFLSGRKKTENS